MTGALALITGLGAVDVSAQLLPPVERSRASSTSGNGPPTISGVHVDSAEEYYVLSESTLRLVIARLNQTHLQGPDEPPSQGLTRYDIRPEWNAVAQGGKCRVRDAEIYVGITVTLPKWPGVDDRPDGEQAGWRTIDAAIREHEYGHRDLILAASGELVDEIRGLDGDDCAALRQVVADILSTADLRLLAAHADLDRATPPRLSVGRVVTEG
jgi:predicted secreted Zn-dependent protease